jgi:hypothetical protein
MLTIVRCAPQFFAVIALMASAMMGALSVEVIRKDESRWLTYGSIVVLDFAVSLFSMATAMLFTKNLALTLAAPAMVGAVVLLVLIYVGAAWCLRVTCEFVAHLVIVVTPFVAYLAVFVANFTRALPAVMLELLRTSAPHGRHA